MDAARRRRCDEHLDAAVADLLAHDPRVRDLSLTARADGGVVHLTGDVADPAQLVLIRRLIGHLAGVHGVWDRIRIAGRAPVVLDLGCGSYKQYPTNIGVDRRHTPAVAVRADLTAPLPFADTAVDRIFLVHVLEHLVDYLPLVNECHRVLKQGGVLHVLSPWWRHVNAVADPTHVRLLDTQTFKQICDFPGVRRWHPLHVSRDESTVFADLTPVGPEHRPDPVHLARFFD